MDDDNKADVRFIPVLTLSERKAVYALFHFKKVSVKILSWIFKINDRTVFKICDNTGKKYLSVKAEAKLIGAEKMYEHHVTKSMQDRVDRFKFGDGIGSKSGDREETI
jgi:hypothetical protein